MEAALTKIFATPEAHHYITNGSLNEKTTRSVIAHLIKAADGGKKFFDKDGSLLRLRWDSQTGYEWPVTIHTREEKTEIGLIRTVLVCSNKGEPSNNPIITDDDDEAFYQAVQTAIEIPIL